VCLSVCVCVCLCIRVHVRVRGCAWASMRLRTQTVPAVVVCNYDSLLGAQHILCASRPFVGG